MLISHHRSLLKWAMGWNIAAGGQGANETAL